MNVQTGDRFGNLTVVKEGEKRNGHKHYICACDCGNTTLVDKYNLLRGTTLSCGCLRQKNMNIGKRNKYDLSGRTFGNIEIISIDENCDSGCGKHIKWIGKCKLCGSIKSYRGSDLRSGAVTNCGCTAIRTNVNLVDYTGKHIGNLYVIAKENSDHKNLDYHAKWICRCELCGRTEVISGGTLKRGRDRCRKCMGSSLGETKITELLEANNMRYIKDKGYKDCIYDKTGGRLRFDFIVTDEDETDYVIEFDGEQHYKPVPTWESKIDYIGRQERDEYKNSWCRKNGIPIIRIPYTHMSKLCIDDLLPSVSNYLVS